MFVGALSPEFEALSIEALKGTTADEMVCCIVEKLQLPLPVESYELAEVVGNAVGQECKERRLAPHELPVALMLLWPKVSPSRDQETASALAALAAHRKLLQRSISKSVVKPSHCYHCYHLLTSPFFVSISIRNSNVG